MLIIFLTVENNVCLLSPLLLQGDSLICWCRLGAGRLGGGFDSVGRLSLWQACCEGSALRRHPSGLGTARAASHFLLMTSYVARVVQKSRLEMEKHHNGISRVVLCSSVKAGTGDKVEWQVQLRQPAGELGRSGNKADILFFECRGLEQAEEWDWKSRHISKGGICAVLLEQEESRKAKENKMSLPVGAKADVDNLLWFRWSFPSLIPLPVQERDSSNNFLGSQQALCEQFLPQHFLFNFLAWRGQYGLAVVRGGNAGIMLEELLVISLDRSRLWYC